MKRPKVTGLRRRESWQALPFLLPSLLGLCLFYLFPLAETVRASFMDPLRSRAVGWGNYRALFQNTAFRLAVRNTCRFLCICIPALLAVSLLCAVLLGAAKRRAVFFKSVLLLPYAIPVASIVVLWRALFSGKGLVNGLLYGQQRGLLGADFHLPLAKQRVRYAAVAGGSGDHPPALV